MKTGSLITYQDHCSICRRPCSTVATTSGPGRTTSTVHRSDCHNAPTYAQRAPEAIGTALEVEA